MLEEETKTLVDKVENCLKLVVINLFYLTAFSNILLH